MSAVDNGLDPAIASIHIGTLAATTTLPGLYFRKHSKIKAIHFLNQAGIVADDTNYLQLSLQKLSDSSVLAALDTRAAHDGAVTAMTPIALTQTGEIDVPAGTTLQLVATKNGTGVPTLAKLQVEYYPL